MPFPLFHLAAGAGLWAKRDLFYGFVLGNVAIDTEVAARFLFGMDTLHGVFHTLMCAVALTLSFWCVSKYTACAVGMGIGGVSHVLLDSIVHTDVKPFAPLSDWSPLYGLLSWHQTEVLCLIIAAIGILVLRVYSREPQPSPARGAWLSGPDE